VLKIFRSISMKGMGALAVAFFGMFLLSACEDNTDHLLKYYEHRGVQGNTHFVYIKRELVQDKMLQREIGKKICLDFGNTDYCEIYFWDNPRKVATRLPVANRKDVVSIYSWKNGKVRLNLLR